jgi:formyltetrahydrofolate deformylase
MTRQASRFVLTLRCQDAVGIVAAVTTALAKCEAFIVESSHFGDPGTGLFFMRTVFEARGPRYVSRDDFERAITPVIRDFAIDAKLVDGTTPPKVLLAVSRHGHCLNHLLHQWHGGELPIDVVGVVSNHDDMRRLSEWYRLPFHLLPDEGGRPGREAKLLELFEASDAELLVLARFMQILSDDLCNRLKGRCINIHHSFLPSFKGAKPYHQAYDRGVKVVGATAHYVTADLDEGPIIEQDTIRVDHTLDADAFVRLGKDVENVVLARAVRWHCEHRVLLNGHRTVVFKHGA